MLLSAWKYVLIDEVFETVKVLPWVTAADIVVEYAEEIALQSPSCRVLTQQINNPKEVDFLFACTHHVVSK